MQNQHIQTERKWAKSRAKDPLILPNATENPKGYKDAVKKNRTRLRLEFINRDGFNFLLSHNHILRNLKETSYCEQGPDETIIVHLDYLPEKRGRIFDFLAEEWKPYIGDVTADRGPINKIVDPHDELVAAIIKVVHPAKEKEKGNEEILENEMEVEVDGVAQKEAQPTETEIRSLEKKRKRELQKELCNGVVTWTEVEALNGSENSDYVLERSTSELKKLKTQAEQNKMAIEHLKEQIHILESTLRQLAKFTGKIITMVPVVQVQEQEQEQVQAPEDATALRQEFNAILQTLRQQDTELALEELDLDLYLAPESQLNGEEQAANIKELEELFQESSTSKKIASRSQSQSQSLSDSQSPFDFERESRPNLEIEPSGDNNGGDDKSKSSIEDIEEVKVAVETEKKTTILIKENVIKEAPVAGSVSVTAKESAATINVTNKKSVPALRIEKKRKNPQKQQQQPLSAKIISTAEIIKQYIKKKEVTPKDLLADKNTHLEWVSVLSNYPFLFE